VTAVHDISDGGLLVALAEMAMALGIGAVLEAPSHWAVPPAAHAFWFGEDQARFIVTAKAAEIVMQRAKAAGVPLARLGVTSGAAPALAGERLISRRISKLGSRPIWRARPKRRIDAWRQAPHCGRNAAQVSRIILRIADFLSGASRNEQVKRAMAMVASDIERLIRVRIPDAEVTIRDLAGDGDHYAATVIAESFRGKSRVQQHQIVYEALKAEMGGKLHALALQTGTPER
jgi:stress-induced morphogen